MKRILTIILLLTLAVSLASCIQTRDAEALTTVNDTTKETDAETKADIPVDGAPVLPQWSDPESAAESFLGLDGLIVNDSKSEYSYDEMVADLAELAKTYPTHFSYRSIGRSVLGREIYVAVLGDTSAEKQILVSAGIHGREYLTPLLVMKQIEFYLAYYDIGDYKSYLYSEMLEEFCFYIVPMTNPDGIMLAQGGINTVSDSEVYNRIYQIYNSDFSKELTDAKTVDEYLKIWKANANGVDLNRNFDALWNEYKKGISVPSHRNYKGTAAASEPETRAMVALTESLSNIQAVLCIHSQGEVLYWDCGQKDTLATQTRELTQVIADRTKYYIVDQQNNDASFSDWCALKKGLIAITVETGTGSCPLPHEQFAQIWSDNFDLLPLTALFFSD